MESHPIGDESSVRATSPTIAAAHPRERPMHWHSNPSPACPKLGRLAPAWPNIKWFRRIEIAAEKDGSTED